MSKFKDKTLKKERKKYVADFTIHYIPNASHWVMEEVPEQVNQYLLDWLDSQD
jgi:pimeloyl-ACP methyl ester carboxylesterase